ncbi:hypothetical protein [Streptomyces sp. AcH 505]|uniref:hypothetical protein n=1 Tax=Streptomyces sp. AcH 505 TaxID=352211 RepID=UPI0012FEBA4F
MPAQHPPQPTTCLLHADVHLMGAACWDTTLDWYFTHQHVHPDEARDAYQAEAERRMLDHLIKEHQGQPY